MSSNIRRKIHRNTDTVNLGCSCRRLKFSTICHPTPKTKSTTFKNPNPHRSSSTSRGTRNGDGGGLSIDDDDDNPTTTSSPKLDTSPRYSEAELYSKTSNAITGSARFRESIVVVKDSSDPFLDFRHSMLQMILEKEIYSRDDLQELLHCFLKLNSPSHHDTIVRAFMEIWNGASG